MALRENRPFYFYGGNNYPIRSPAQTSSDAQVVVCSHHWNSPHFWEQTNWLHPVRTFQL